MVKMMKWRPWPLVATKSFLVKLKLHRLEDLPLLMGMKSGDGSSSRRSAELSKVMIHVKWKGPRGALGSHFKRSLKRAKTTEKPHEDGPVVTWDEEFEHTCTLTITKDGEFLPWDIHFIITQVGVKSKSVLLGTATMNVAKFVPGIENMKQAAKIRVFTSSGAKCEATLVVSADIIELRTPENMGFEYPILSCISGPQLCHMDGELVEVCEEERLQIPSILTSNNAQTSAGNDNVVELSPKTEQASDSSRNSFDSDTSYEWVGEAIDADEYCIGSYGSLTGVNLVVEGALSRCKENKHVDDSMPCTCKRGFLDSPTKGGEQMTTSDSEQGAHSSVLNPSVAQSSVRSILAWRKRKLNFRSPRRGEPLLNKDYGEDGGDDIDFDRRLSGLPLKPLPTKSQGDALSSNGSGCLDFGDEHFAVGSWERRDFTSRDSERRLSADVFFATIDQRNERAAGESACTVLVAVVASWLHQNRGRMPIKAEFDTLIREGSSEWRKLCDDGAYKDLFPDRHFDLDTVLRAKVRPLVELPDKSFIGFFVPNGLRDSCDYLNGAMSFDSIWKELIAKVDEDLEPAVYIVSWNDHFFILKVDVEICYIIDTLGERLQEGGNRAYILRFDKDTRICHIPKAEQEKGTSSDLKAGSSNEKEMQNMKQVAKDGSFGGKDLANQFLVDSCTTDQLNAVERVGCEPIYTGREACKEFIEGFFAALTLRELETDIKKGMRSGISMHQRLQIEFHYASLVDECESNLLELSN